jgi:hypothetical protein
MAYKDKTKKNEYSRAWVAKRRAEYLGGKACLDCGATEKLEIHHLDPSQKEGHAIFSWRRERIESELKKCVVLCSTCHHKRHGAKELVHGTINAWRHKKCRCEKCREAHAEDVRKYRQRAKV